MKITYNYGKEKEDTNNFDKKMAIQYFEGKYLEEGDNITITCDFLDNLEIILEMAKRNIK